MYRYINNFIIHRINSKIMHGCATIMHISVVYSLVYCMHECMYIPYIIIVMHKYVKDSYVEYIPHLNGIYHQYIPYKCGTYNMYSVTKETMSIRSYRPEKTWFHW